MESDEDEDDDKPFGDDEAKNAAFRASMAPAQLERHRREQRNKTYAMRVSYDGERYVGFQYQGPGTGDKNKTIQGELERCLCKMTGETRESLRVGGAGRTDSGVHARGQVVHFYCRKSLGEDLSKRKRAMNGMLPDDIRCEEFWEPHPLFHSRFHAKGKIYHYYLDAKETASPFSRKYAHRVGWRPPDVDLLRRACALFVGTMDFKSFANVSRDKSKADQNTVRTIRRFDVFEDEPGTIRLECEGDGFLYRQVRNMVGAALTVATGKHDLEYLQNLIDAKDRKRAPMGAPAHGLFLHRVFYPSVVLTKPADWIDDDDDDDDEYERQEGEEEESIAMR